MELVVATRNAGKLREIAALLDGSGIVVLGLEAFSGLPDVEEDAETFAGNARKKALTVARFTGRLTLADDSGLEVDALAGAPGVYSARYAGVQGDDAANNAKLLEALAGVPAERRGAAFVCAMALCSPEGDCRYFFGRLPGTILSEQRGNGGFGYDPLFFLPDYQRTLAELPMGEKNAISHRGQALRQAVAVLLS